MLKSGATTILVSLVQHSLLEAQCSLCRRALTDAPEGQAMAAGLNHAILLLLAAPFFVAACVGFAIYRGSQTKSR